MANKFGIPYKELLAIIKRDELCSYCCKKMIYPYDVSKRKDSATIEHLNFDGPFYWKDELQAVDIVMCCGSCNSSRGVKKLQSWFSSDYCMKRNINKHTVSELVKDYLNRKK